MAKQKGIGKLNDQQVLFVDKYVELQFNATEAAIAAGYSAKTARAQGSRLLTNADVQTAIHHRIQKLSQQSQMSALEVVQGLARIASSNPMDFFDLTVAGQPRIDFSKLTREQAYAIQSIKTKSYRNEQDDAEDEIVTETEVKFEPKIAALNTLAKYHGLLLGKRGGAGDGDFEDRIDLTEINEEELLEEIVLRRRLTTRTIKR